MKVCMLGSGSRGNATLVEAEGTRVLIDAGFSGRQLERRLAEVGVEADSVDAVVITHEHGDHTRGMGVFARRYGTALFLTSGTRGACARLLRGSEKITEYRPGRSFRIGSIRVEPFLTVHDAVDPVAVTVVGEGCGTRVGVATDLGRPTAQIRHSLRDCDFLILESNHDEGLLQQAPYPPSVRTRIASSHGHLSNRAAASFALELLHPRLCGVLLAHLSQEANDPELARDTVSLALDGSGFEGYLEVASQDRPSAVVDLPRLRRLSGPEQPSFL